MDGRRIWFVDDGHGPRATGRAHLRSAGEPAGEAGGPPHLPTLLALARGALCAHRYDVAESCLRRVIRLDEGSAEAHTLMGVLHEALGEPNSAYRSFRAALEADPSYQPASASLRRYCGRFGIDPGGAGLDPGSRGRRPLRRPDPVRRGAGPRDTPRSSLMALTTFVLGVVFFTLFFGLVAACDRL